MEFIYVCMPKSGGEWEDFEIYLTEADAIEATRKHTNIRAEIFVKKGTKYVPTYKFFVNGEYQ